MACHTAIGVNNDLAPGQTGVAVRSPDDKTAGGVDEIFGLVVQKLLRENRIKDVFLNILVDLFLCDLCVMLCGKDNCLQSLGLAVFVVFHGNLGLAVRPQVIQGAVLAHLRQLQRQLVGERDRVGHQLGRLVCGIAKHHPLVAGAGVQVVRHAAVLSLQSLVNSHGDVG